MHEGQEINLEGILDGSPQLVACKIIERIIRHGRGEWNSQCLVLDKSTLKNLDVHIQPIINKHKKILDDFLPGLPPKRGFYDII